MSIHIPTGTVYTIAFLESADSVYNLQRGHVGTFLACLWKYVCKHLPAERCTQSTHMVVGPRQPACIIYQPIQYCWVHTCPLPRLPSSYMQFAYGYPTSSSTETGEHLVYHLMLMVWTRPNANQYHVCTMGSGIGGMGGGGGGGRGSVEQTMLVSIASEHLVTLNQWR